MQDANGGKGTVRRAAELISGSFTIYGQSFSLFTSILGLVIASALTSVGYHTLAATGRPELLHWASIVRCIYHAALYSIFLLFVINIAEVTHLEPRGRLPYFIVSELLRQGLSGKTSFTVATFMFPVIGMFYVMHSNPYDVEIGAVDATALKDAVHYNYTKDKDFVYICRKGDLNDPRVLCYCQPVFNIHTQRYDTAEAMCIKMCASYLQGYKYSRPVPIETLTEYFEKAA